MNVPLSGGDDTHHPAVLSFSLVEGGTKKTYSLSYYETDAGQAIYRTPVTAVADRLSAARTLYDLNIQDAQDEWLFQSDATTEAKTLDKAQLQQATNSPTPVREAPANPRVGMRIQPLNDISVPGGAIMVAQEYSASGANYIGYLDASSRTSSSDLGSLTPENDSIAGFLSYTEGHNTATFRNKTVFQDRGCI